MFTTLMDVVAWAAVIGLMVVAFMLVSAGLGALVGKTLALFKRS